MKIVQIMHILKKIIFIFLIINLQLAYAQDSIRFYKTIDTLCSPYFYGRGYEQNGHLKTADYLMQTFKAARSLEIQKFSFEINRFEGNMHLGLDKTALNSCSDYIPISQAKGGKGKGEIIELDSLFFADTASINSFINQNIKHKIILYKEIFESKITSKPLLREKIYTEAQAIIKLTPSATLRTFSTTAWMPPSFSVVDSLYQNQNKACFELHQSISKIESQNIIATIEGKDTSKKELIVCAHYDHVGGYEDCYIPGANDNASGVAMLIELYSYFLENQPEQNIKFIAFAGEEVGLLGSKYYTENADLSKIGFVLNLDLYGAGSEGVTVVNATVFPLQFAILETLNDQNNYVSKIKKRGKAANSDHYHFSEKGIPAFFIYSNGKAGGYHNIQDVPSKLEIGHFNNLFFLLKDFLINI